MNEQTEGRKMGKNETIHTECEICGTEFETPVVDYNWLPGTAVTLCGRVVCIWCADEHVGCHECWEEARLAEGDLRYDDQRLEI